MPTPNYTKLAVHAHWLRLSALRLEQAAQNMDDKELFIAYCEIIVHHEKIRDIVAGRN